MGRKKIRFVALQDGKPRELFNVREGSTGDLSILIRGTDNMFRDVDSYEIGNQNPLIEQRISIHRSDRSVHLGTTIVQTQVTANGETERLAGFIKNSKKNLMWPVYSYLYPDLSPKNYDISERNTSSYKIIARESPPQSSLIAHIFAVGSQREEVHLPFCDMTATKFKNFSLFVYVNYLNAPHTSVGIGASMPTSASEINGKPSPYYKSSGYLFPDGAISLRDDEMASVIYMLNHRLASTMMQMMAKLVPDKSDEILHHKLYFTRHPISPERPNLVIGPQPGMWIPPIQV